MYSRRHFILTGLGLGAATLLNPELSFASNPGTLRAGSGRAHVELSGLYPLGDFVSEHDPLCVRVLLMDNAVQRQAIAVVDLTSLTEEVIVRMKVILAGIANVTTMNTTIIASHSFSTPHISIAPEHAQDNIPQTLAILVAFEDALRTASRRALDTLQPARLGAGSGYCRIGVNRNIVTPQGWWLGADDSGYSDPHVGVLRIDGQDGQPLAVLMNYAVQPAVMDASQCVSGGRLISADLAGSATHCVETRYGGKTVAFYLVGCAGDQVPYLQASRHIVHPDGSVGRTDIHEQGFTLVDLFGRRLGDEVVRVADAISTSEISPLKLQRTAISLPKQAFSPRHQPTGPVKTFTWREIGPGKMPVILMQWGNTVLIGVQPELSASTGAYMRSASPFPNTFIMTMVDGADKYLPDSSNYDHFTYESRSSPYAPGAAEQAAEAIIDQLKQLNRNA